MVGSPMKTERWRTEFCKNYGQKKASLAMHGRNTNARKIGSVPSAAGPDVVSDRSRSFGLSSSSTGPRQYDIRIRIQLQPASTGDVAPEAVRLAISQALVFGNLSWFSRDTLA